MGPLLSTQGLAERLGAPRLRVFDATVHLLPAKPGPYTVQSGRADYEAAHIPGAAFADLSGELSDTSSPLRFTLPPLAQLEAAVASLGLSNGDDCVIYSSTSPMWATRLWWMLRSMGFDAAVLDGGLAKWRAEGRASASGAERYPAGRFRAAPRGGLWVDKAEVLRAIGDGEVCTINALTASAHAGTAATHYGRPGHVAGSVNVPYPSLLHSDGTFKAVDELRSAFEAAGALSRPSAICYCGGGISATMDALALTMLGRPDVAVYDGSLSEWANDPSLPMTTGS